MTDLGRMLRIGNVHDAKASAEAVRNVSVLSRDRHAECLVGHRQYAHLGRVGRIRHIRDHQSAGAVGQVGVTALNRNRPRLASGVQTTQQRRGVRIGDINDLESAGVACIARAVCDVRKVARHENVPRLAADEETPDRLGRGGIRNIENP